MAYYTALQTAWNSVTQPPSGVSGTALSTSMTTLQKVNAVNGWTVIGPAIAPNIPVTNIINAITTTDFMALTSLQLQQLSVVMPPGAETVYAPSGGTVRGVFGTVFAGKTTTLANLTSLVAQYDTPSIAWCQANGYPYNGLTGSLGLVDAAAAGLS